MLLRYSVIRKFLKDKCVAHLGLLFVRQILGAMSEWHRLCGPTVYETDA